MLVSVVVPALNERENIPQTIDAIPVEKLRSEGHDTEIVIVDNGSTDGTGNLARKLGAKVIVQPVRGYGNAYMAGFANCSGEIIATGDADRTYPFEILPEVVSTLENENIDFLTTNRLAGLRPGAMSRSHLWGNKGLSMVARHLFGVPFRDSQSGMWVFRRKVWSSLRLRSGGMAFSQEIKVEAFRYGFNCVEMPITYSPRGGESKNRTITDGLCNLTQLLIERMRPSVSAERRGYADAAAFLDTPEAFQAADPPSICSVCSNQTVPGFTY
ncbi:glycosyltransferase family 2 protein [Actinoplanes solisilvae]|uniref:glycosyltransferase family 2 protein n=1 Tax=Actinoplanes solisilvae TaxID=2486853 RepID=UPI000FDADDDE|nr:glycosyltransferase family 2 protein [Actinoplanes solisilvae]